MKKRFLALFLALALVCAMLPATLLTASAETYSGTCGKNLTWTFDTDTGVLEISGTGGMSSSWSSSEDIPWHSYAESIKDVQIGNGVSNIGQNSFYGCTALTSVTIPDSVTTIGNSAFYGCTGLTSVTIPDSVTSIGWSAFSGCSGLTSISLPFVGDAPHDAYGTNQYPFGWIFGASSYTGGSATTQYYRYGSSTTSSTYYIPNSLKSVTITGSSYIPYGAFYNCTGLTSVTIPDSVTRIGYYAFYSCSGLTSVTIPDSVTRIDAYTFKNCIGLTSITIPDSVTSIGEDAFYNCSNLTSVTIGSGVTSIGSRAFEGCGWLSAVYISDLAAWCEINFEYQTSAIERSPTAPD